MATLSIDGRQIRDKIELAVCLEGGRVGLNADRRNFISLCFDGSSTQASFSFMNNPSEYERHCTMA